MNDLVEKCLYRSGFALLLAIFIAAFIAWLRPKKAREPAQTHTLDSLLEELVHFLAYVFLVVAVVLSLAAALKH